MAARRALKKSVSAINTSPDAANVIVALPKPGKRNCGYTRKIADWRVGIVDATGKRK
jgi:hypothetical protein